MRVLYVKNGSDRDKRFQLQTMIYEVDGKRFVKKSVLCDEALPHLHKMYENYTKLSQAIINPKVKLAKIVDKDDRSLTFEYIDGKSLEKKFQDINDEKEISIFTEEYSKFLKSSFKTTTFNAKEITSECREIFGNFDYSVFAEELCFDGVSNIDLIFSNIIYRDDKIYIIDYEWVFEVSLPIDYILFRLSLNNSIILNKVQFHEIYKKMESNFILNFVYLNSFYKNKYKYNKRRPNLEKVIQEKNQLIDEKEHIIQKKEYDIKYIEKLFFNREQQLHEKELEIKALKELAQSMRIKNRVKKALGFLNEK